MLDAANVTPGEKPGMRSVTEAAYHDDPCREPSMAAHDAEMLARQSPRHCWQQHPKLNPMHPPWVTTNDRDRGTALHGMILGAGRPIRWVDAEAWNTNAAKDARTAAYQANEVPILLVDKPRMEMIKELVHHEINSHPELAEICAGRFRTETTFIWQDGPTLCRARPNLMPDDVHAPLLDLTFTTRSAAASDYAAYIQRERTLHAVHYLRGAEATRDARPAGYWYVAVEVNAPFGFNAFRLSKNLIEGALPVWERARDLFGACLAAGRRRQDWPSYPPILHTVEASDWQHRLWQAQMRQLDTQRDYCMTLFAEDHARRRA